MSIKTEIDRIKQSKADIISALKTKGVTVPSDASIDDLSALVDAISTSEDLSSELSTQNTLITTQETTIDSIISALQGKASGGSGGSVETCTITMKHYPTYSTSFAIQRVAYQTLDDSGNITTEEISYSNGDISYSTNEFILSNVVCPSIMYVSSGGTAILSGGSKIYSYPSAYTHVIKVNETGTFEFQPTG